LGYVRGGTGDTVRVGIGRIIAVEIGRETHRVDSSTTYLVGKEGIEPSPHLPTKFKLHNYQKNPWPCSRFVLYRLK